VFDWIRNMGKTKDDRQFEILDGRLIEIEGKLRKLRTEVKENAQANQFKLARLETLIESGFQEVLDAIAKIQPLPQPQPEPEPFTPFRVEPEAGFIEMGDIRSMQITDSQQFKITFPAPTDKKGFPAKVQDGSVTITVGNDTATVEPNPDDPTNAFSALVKGNRPGADDGSEVTAVTISADADLGEGVKTISKAVELMVTSGEATAFGEPTVGTVEEQP
jgi:hypothetical protein